MPQGQSKGDKLATKYKPCCNNRCLLFFCETREAGGCYCTCRTKDYISHLQSIIEGQTLYDGNCFIYIPNDEKLKQTLDNWSDEKKEIFKEFRDNEAPKLLEKYKLQLKKFEIEE